MFTALVLVCSTAYLEHSPDTCYTVMNKQLSDSYSACVNSYKEALKLKVFDYWDGDTGESWIPVDYQCINWNSQKT